MTEHRWLTCTDPTPMLELLQRNVSDRKLRLFAVACVRRAWSLLTDTRSRHAIEIAEMQADADLDTKELQAASESAYFVKDSMLGLAEENGRWRYAYVSHAAYLTTIIGKYSYAALEAAAHVALPDAECMDAPGTSSARRGEELTAQVQLLRCIFGNPFRYVTAVPSWLVWNNGMVVKLAQTIYYDRSFDRLPILADALEEAGCDNADILNHCRQPGEHVRGCWVVDLLLNKS